MARASLDRKVRYVVEYAALTGPLKRAAELQAKFNKAVSVGSEHLTNFGTQVQNTFNRVGAHISKVTGLMGRFGSALSEAMHSIRTSLVTTRFEVAAMGAVISSTLARMTTSGIQLAVAAEDIRNQFDVSFATVYDRATQVAKKMQSDLKMGEISIKQYLSSAQDLLVGFGYTQEGALGLSEQITRLALDLASWNNVPFDTAMHNMLSGLVGNHEALRGLRIVLTQATLERKAEQLGIKESWKNMSEATKVYLRYKVAIDQSVNAIGDLARTQDETSNRFRFFNEQLKSSVLYIFPKLTLWVGTIAEKFANWMMQSEAIFKEVGDYVARLGFHLSHVADLVIKFLSKWEGFHRATKELMIFSSSIAGIAIPILGIIVIFGRALSVVSVWYGLLLLVAIVIQDIYAVMRGGNGYFREFLNYTGLTTDQIRAFTSSVLEAGKLFVINAKNTIDWGAALQVIKDLFIGTYDIIINDLVPALETLWNVVTRSQIIQNTFMAIYESVRLLGALVGLVGALLAGNSERINKHLIAIKDSLINMTFLVIKGAVQMVWALITELAPKILTSMISATMSLIGIVLAALTRGLVNVVKVVYGVLSYVFKGIFTTIYKVVQDVVAIIGVLSRGLKWVFENVVTASIERVQGAISAVTNKIAAFSKYLPDWVLEKVGLKVVEDNAAPAAPAAATPVVAPAVTPAVLPPSEVVGAPAFRSTEVVVGRSTMSNPNVTFGDINMPIYLPEGFSGDAEEFRKIASEEAARVLNQNILLAFDRNAEEE